MITLFDVRRNSQPTDENYEKAKKNGKFKTGFKPVRVLELVDLRNQPMNLFVSEKQMETIDKSIALEDADRLSVLTEAQKATAKQQGLIVSGLADAKYLSADVVIAKAGDKYIDDEGKEMVREPKVDSVTGERILEWEEIDHMSIKSFTQAEYYAEISKQVKKLEFQKLLNEVPVIS